jgi:hypothetical protein
MRFLALLVNPTVLAMAALLMSVVWMLKDEKDKTRPILVMALVLNLFYGFLLTVVMGRENGIVPWKYDYVLLKLDDSLGLSAAPVAAWLQGAARVPLLGIYQWMVPMMICWYLVSRNRKGQGSVILAYVAEMVAGPVLYAILPACGPLYAFGRQWLNPPDVQANAIRLSGMPNAFPSLHVGTALVFVFFAQGKLWRAVSLAFLACTALATISTGEHYVIDLVAGLAFGCFAASIGKREIRNAILYSGVVLLWTLSVRFDYAFLIDHAVVLRTFAALTVGMAMVAVGLEWSSATRAADGARMVAKELRVAGDA